MTLRYDAVRGAPGTASTSRPERRLLSAEGGVIHGDRVQNESVTPAPLLALPDHALEQVRTRAAQRAVYEDPREGGWVMSYEHPGPYLSGDVRFTIAAPFQRVSLTLTVTGFSVLFAADAPATAVFSFVASMVQFVGAHQLVTSLDVVNRSDVNTWGDFGEEYGADAVGAYRGPITQTVVADLPQGDWWLRTVLYGYGSEGWAPNSSPIVGAWGTFSQIWMQVVMGQELNEGVIAPMFYAGE